MGMTRKFMTIWNPCISCNADPIAVPNAAKAMAIKALRGHRGRRGWEMWLDELTEELQQKAISSASRAAGMDTEGRR